MGKKSDGMTYPGLGDSKPQKLGDEDNLQAPGYDNDTKDTWVRGANENATTKPGFDSTSKRLAGGKHRNAP